MVLAMEFLEALPLNPCVNLRRRDIGVSKERLDDSQVRAAL